jgi:hypothetical protein
MHFKDGSTINLGDGIAKIRWNKIVVLWGD